MYGTQTVCSSCDRPPVFENDVKMYGTQTYSLLGDFGNGFENDVKMYGTQTIQKGICLASSLRMM